MKFTNQIHLRILSAFKPKLNYFLFESQVMQELIRKKSK